MGRRPGDRRVVVTGLGTINAAGLDPTTSWARVRSGQSAVTDVTRFDATDFQSRIAGEVRGFDGEALLGRKHTRRMGIFQQFGMVVANQAMADAGFVKGGQWPDPDTFGVYMGTGIGGFNEIVEEAAMLDKYGARRVSAFFIPRALINLATGNLSVHLKACGPTLCHATACAASNHSIGEAFRLMKMGEADVMLAGGTEAILCPLAFGGFTAIKALSTRNDDPGSASRPFDRDRDGFVIAEGAGAVLLESLEHAQRRGARIYAELVGYGATSDGHHITAPDPEGRGAARCMSAALRSAGLQPDEVDYINAHGTSTQLNDVVETMAIRAVFGPHADELAVSSTKGVTGHALGAAGGLEAVFTCLALHDGIAPPTANLSEADPRCDLDYVAEGARSMSMSVALSNGFGFGGTNGTLAFRRWEG